MPTIQIQATWTFDTALHVGSGLSSPAYADRIVRRSSISGAAEIDGDGIKGAIRLSAERLCRWYAEHAVENGVSSATAHPILNRIFRNSGVVRWRFQPSASAGVDRFRVAATAINADSGVADSRTLRVIENFASGAAFDVTIEAKGGEFDSDVRFLILALVLTESLGGKRTSGLGRISCSRVRYRVDGGPRVDVTPDIAASWVTGVVNEVRKLEQEVPSP
ncbi:MAG: RAMP superfamily CRISPR-associated protein [Bryobacteraceae bacterium]|jgi:CRISPR/Cas system CSM-associated protein Csm3 (group 7 of RAMP superfamily)